MFSRNGRLTRCAHLIAQHIAPPHLHISVPLEHRRLRSGIAGKHSRARGCNYVETSADLCEPRACPAPHPKDPAGTGKALAGACEGLPPGQAPSWAPVPCGPWGREDQVPPGRSQRAEGLPRAAPEGSRGNRECSARNLRGGSLGQDAAWLSDPLVSWGRRQRVVAGKPQRRKGLPRGIPAQFLGCSAGVVHRGACLVWRTAPHGSADPCAHVL